MKMIVTKPEKCIACHLCEGACSFSHEQTFQPSLTRIWVHDFVEEAYYFPVTCFHCADAPCKQVCPTFAIVREPSGQVKVIDDKCIGCKMCLLACPFGVMGFHEQKGVAQNCDLCGGDPQCVKVCTVDALEFIDTDTVPWKKQFDFAKAAAAARA